MTDDDLKDVLQLQAALTPDLQSAIDALLAGTPEATDEEIEALLRDRFPEVFAKNRSVIDAIGLYYWVEQERAKGGGRS